MATLTIEMPRPGARLKPALLTQAGRTVVIVGLTPGAHGGVAALQYTNPVAGGSNRLHPAGMEVLLLQELPSVAGRLDVAASRKLLQDLLAAAPPGATTLLYARDSTGGAAHLQRPGAADAAERTYQQLLAALSGLPATKICHVTSSSMAQTLRLNYALLKKKVALDTALALFPQAANQIRSMSQHSAMVHALLVVAHVAGAKVHAGAAVAGPVPANVAGPVPEGAAGAAAGAAGAAGAAAVGEAAAAARAAGGREGVERAAAPAAAGPAAAAATAAAAAAGAATGARRAGVPSAAAAAAWGTLIHAEGPVAASPRAAAADAEPNLLTPRQLSRVKRRLPSSLGSDVPGCSRGSNRVALAGTSAGGGAAAGGVKDEPCVIDLCDD